MFWLAKWAGPSVFRFYMGTTRLDLYRHPRAARLERRGKPVIYAFWHGRMLVPAFFYRNRGIRVLISEAREGEYVARLAAGLGFVTLRGSTTRGGRGALIAMAREARRGHSLAITPDGPQGPRYRVQPGTIALARLSGAPVLPCGVGIRSYWEMPSWDAFQAPKPFTRSVGLIGEPIAIPPHLDKTGSGAWGRRIESEMSQLTERAESMVRRDKGGEVP